jgi:hypothetical protein
MFLFPNHSIRALGLLGSLLFLFSCASYNNQSKSYYAQLVTGNYDGAARALEHNKLLNKQRNRLLFLLERGKVEHLAGRYELSNRYFNEADDLAERVRLQLKDLALGTLLNPMMQQYRGEDFEKYMLHYYKALNYLQLRQPAEALVEARRITLRTQTQEDENGHRSRYTADAFSFMLQGMIYEKNRDINNAFIAYRNAADVFLGNGGIYYGTPLPLQLKKDLLRTAYLNGFTDELHRYERLFNYTFVPADIVEDEVIVFWENGLAPVKSQQDLVFTVSADGSGALFFVDGSGSFRIPFDEGNGAVDGKSLAGLKTFRIAIPRYIQQTPRYEGATLLLNNKQSTVEAAQNINDIAFATLKERMLRELSIALTRLAIKKAAEAAANAKKEDDKSASKGDDKRTAVSIGLQLFNFASEKADTRNWQSLPHTIYYARLPLQKGTNILTMDLSSPWGNKKVETPLINNGGMSFVNLCSVGL